ncbi:MAG TPA: hypothetical protein VGQ83_08905 [Polyangia bacterium]
MRVVRGCSIALGLSFVLALIGPACSDAAGEEDYGITGPFQDTEPLGKADNAGIPGPLVNTNTSDTQVWSARNQWEDRDTAAAKLAGMAWPANSGLNWDEKYVAWVQSLAKVPGNDTYYDTFQVTTPWGKTVPAPKLECSENAMFLRIAFASWYELPFYMTATDDKGVRVFFGHFGARTATKRYAGTPQYALSYKDYTKDFANKTPAEIAAKWPKDTKLRARGLSGADDVMDYIAAGARAGAYFDEVFLNKRVGYYLLLMLDYFGSMNLANSRNTYNLKPQALRTGDVLVERWQANGIGHTLVAKSVIPLDGGRLQAELVSGSMPRRQPKWDDAVQSKEYFTSEMMGGEGTSYEGDEYVKLGGGLKRWRVTKNVRGYWTNTWMAADESSWISDTDWARLKTRPAEFESILGEVPPEQQRDALLRMISDARSHLKEYPASCSARENREKAFGDLYALAQRAFGQSASDVDTQYRVIDDYVFAPLVYTQSKTCCWNSSTAAMYQIIMDYEQTLQGTCHEPVVFKAAGGGYKTFSDYAAQTGRSLQWKPWTEDEPCAQRGVDTDLEADHAWIPWCTASAGR